MSTYWKLVLRLALPIVVVVGLGGAADLYFNSDLFETVLPAAVALLTFVYFITFELFLIRTTKRGLNALQTSSAPTWLYSPGSATKTLNNKSNN